MDHSFQEPLPLSPAEKLSLDVLFLVFDEVCTSYGTLCVRTNRMLVASFIDHPVPASSMPQQSVDHGIQSRSALSTTALSWFFLRGHMSVI